jgi:uncharacterized NAD-dependent epimerase/dehydratase family protein
MLTPTDRLVILLHDGILNAEGKTGLAMLRYSELPIVAVIDAQAAGRSLRDCTGIDRDCPIVASVDDALAYGPTVLAIGIAPSGGQLPESWFREIQGAVAAGLSIANGLHGPLAGDPRLAPLQSGQWIWDLRREPQGLPIGSGLARNLPCKRILAVGTDMAIGKMSACISLDRAARSTGLRSKFVATGQAGILISGGGIPLDAIRVDFAAGAVEQWVVSEGEGQDLLWIEGQGSLLHPASTATLPLMRGSQPTGLILVHRSGQTHIRRAPTVPIPPLRDVIHLYETLAYSGGAFEPAPVLGIALNTAHLGESEAQIAIDRVQQETGLPCTDVVRYGAEPLLTAVIEDAEKMG